MRSENFLVVGEAGEAELRSMALRLEEFRAVFAQLLPADYFASSTPTTILFFANDDEYKPFKPLHEGRIDQYVAGYFRSSPEVNYITLAAASTQEATLSVLFHEYVHSLVRNRYNRAPVWFDEGLAEYYSAYDLLNNKQQVRLGKRLTNRANYLRTHELLPLDALLTTTRDSGLYNEHDERNVFYAQSWALIHFLLGDGSVERHRQLAAFLDLLTAGASIEEAIKPAYGIAPATFERQVRGYIRLAQYPEHIEKLAKQPLVSTATQAKILSEAEAQSYLGDLLLCTDRAADAEAYLQKALTLDPDLAAANLSLGILHLRENRLAEAGEHLRKALAADSQNHLAHYHNADLLRREALESQEAVAGYAQKIEATRAELKKTIELNLSFLDAYALLAFVDIEMTPQLDEARETLKRAMQLAPKRREFNLLLAQLYIRREQFEAARTSLDALIHDRGASSLVKLDAQTLLEQMPFKEKIAADRRQLNGNATNAAFGSQPSTQPCDMPEPGPQFKPARFFGAQVCGQLVKIDCAPDAGVLLFIITETRTLKLHSDALEHIKFVTYTPEATNAIGCGQQSAARRVLVTYRTPQQGKTAADGELIAVEFVPAEWLH